MQEKIVKFKTAKLARKKGFYPSSYEIKNVPEDFYYEVSDSRRYVYAHLNGNNKNEVELVLPFVFKEQNLDYIYLCDAPTQSLLQKWLREVHNVYVVSRPSNTDDGLKKSKFVSEIYFNHRMRGLYGQHNVVDYFSSYEEALEKGLQEALKLIKI